MSTKTYEIRRSRLEGAVRLSGAKNAILAELPASLLTKETVIFDNCPANLLDVKEEIAMLQYLGKQINVDGNTLEVTESCEVSSVLIWDNRSIRSTLQILAALLARTGKGAVPLPGGCPLGERKYDIHIMVMESYGAKVWEENNLLMAESVDGLIGTDIYLPIRSTGATETAILCACLAKGKTSIWNPHVRPEIIDLINLLQKMGAHIHVHGQQSIEAFLGFDKKTKRDYAAIVQLLNEIASNNNDIAYLETNAYLEAV